MLTGETVPRQSSTVQAVLEVLCERAGFAAHAETVTPSGLPFLVEEEIEPSPWEILLDLWRNVHDPPQEASGSTPQAFSDDPPF